MNEHVTQTLELAKSKVRDLEEKLVAAKRAANAVCELDGRPPIYTDSDLEVTHSAGPIRSDAYYGQPMATAIRMVLERRHAAQMGPASVADIYDALIAGGYKFNAKNDENAKRGLYGSLSKNTATFHKLPNGDYGLLEWYPSVKEERSQRSNGNGTEAEENEAEAEDTGTDDELVSVGADGENDSGEAGDNVSRPNKPR